MCLGMLKYIFNREDFEVVVAINGHEAFEIVLETLTGQGGELMTKYHQIFDLVILDLNMPISDGFESCKNIKKLYE